MVLSDWNKLKNNITVEYTRKKFYNEFLYRLSYNIQGIRIIAWIKDELQIDEKVDAWNLRVSQGMTNWYYDDPVRKDQITDFYFLYQTKSKDLKFRIERNTFSIYSNSENFLYDLASTKLNQWKDQIINISLVESPKSLDLLNQGFTIVKTELEYQYRIKLREGFQKLSERKGLATYLGNLGDEVRCNKLILDRLIYDTKYFAGGYIYLKDPRLIDMLKMVAPSVIGPVNQLVNQ
jgi:hypothetical protein